MLDRAAGVGYEDLHRLLLPQLDRAAAEIGRIFPGLEDGWDGAALRVNGAGDFSCGGPHGDNGLSGKKLVVDHWGPDAPIGGGAFCGKDPHKVDRTGALRARQLAVRLARQVAQPVTTTLSWLPGGEEPDAVFARLGDDLWDLDRISATVALPDLRLAGSVRDLDLASVRWRGVLQQGYFGHGRAWES